MYKENPSHREKSIVYRRSEREREIRGAFLSKPVYDGPHQSNRRSVYMEREIDNLYYVNMERKKNEKERIRSRIGSWICSAYTVKDLEIVNELAAPAVGNKSMRNPHIIVISHAEY